MPAGRIPLDTAKAPYFRKGTRFARASNKTMKRFYDLLLLHRELDDLFLEHQRALVLGQFETALERLEAYARCLDDHIRDEEDVLLLIYSDRVTAPVGGTTEIFLNEHRKIKEYLALFKAEFPKLIAAVDRERAIIFLLDSQTTFKRLLVHHDTRERKFLYPLLDQVTTETERLSIFSKLRINLNEVAGAIAAGLGKRE
jgi:hypothetical protein